MKRYYRYCFLDRKGEIRSFEGFTAAGDNKAIAEAERLFARFEHYAGFEVRQGSRLVTSGRRGIIRERMAGRRRRSE